MKRKMGRLKSAVNSVTDRLPGGERRRVLRGRPKTNGLSDGELARLKGYSEHQAGVAHTPHIGNIGGPGVG
ncbi:MAG: hypothetical protein OXD50_00925 [Chloroflexi bacterium]|nr:hypothetical protein [Chloroflexota bacterium]